MKNNKGITLIALVITIIVLLILAGVTIALVIGDNGILNKSEQAGEEYTKAAIKEEMELGILDIQAELSQKNPPESLTKQKIIDNLASRLENTFTITDTLDGEYKGYEYYIDDDYVVHIGNRVSGMSVYLKTQKVGTTYFTVVANARSTYGNITGYKYVIDGVEKPQTANGTYTQENLEEKTEHTVKVIAMDEKGNQKESRIIKIVTEEKVYLYRNGNQYEKITGGWVTGGKYFEGTGSVSINEDNITITSNVTYDANSFQLVNTKEKVDLSAYSKLYAIITQTAGTDDYSVFCAGNKLGADRLGTSIYGQEYTSTPAGNQNRKLLKLDIDKIQENRYIGLESFVYRSGTSKVVLHEMWLEK